MHSRFALILLSLLPGAAVVSRAQSVPPGPAVELSPYTVYGRAEPLLGEALTAAQGQVGAAELAARPFLRRGELLEVIPGLVVTQHSGGGKANQYFLRGFNLDHGTDFSVSADGVPVNMRTHAHGQGYADLNFVIPELVDGISFNKGPFFAAVGDFSAAGASDIRFFNSLPQDFVTVGAGGDSYYRGAAGVSMPAGTDNATLTLAGEYSSYDGPWQLPEAFRRVNGFARYHREDDASSVTLTALAYDGRWDSTDQIPLRAIADGRLDRFGAADPSDGGTSSRFGLTYAQSWRGADTATRASLFATRYRLDLFSDFTYFLEDPVHGDQFEQFDKRWIIGGSLEHEWKGGRGDSPASTTVGLQWRSDLIDEVGLFHATARARFSTVRSDGVDEHSVGAFITHESHWSDHLRTVMGLRADTYRFHVDSDFAVNSGRADDTILSPKASVIYAPGPQTELYLSAGTGFHSNDARGTTIAVDPASGDPAERVDPLVRSKSVEVGVRSAGVAGLVSTLSAFLLDLDSELLFVGDAGNTEASGASRRLGVEWANFWQVHPWLAFDLDIALTHARFKDGGAEGDHIPGSIDRVVSGGVVVGGGAGWFGSLRGRYFGPRPLIEDASVTGEDSFLCNLRVGYRGENWQLALDVLNVFNRQDNDIEYYYASRLPGEPDEGIDDVHLHPAEPRTVRAAATWRF